MSKSGGLTQFAWLSIAAAVTTIALKTGAWALTGSVGLLSDALESLVNLVAAAMTLAMLTVASKPPDEEHTYGHGKAEYFASGVEGALILLAAVGIGWAAIGRLMAPAGIEQPWLGLAISTLASLVNFVTARVLLNAARKHHSIALEADSRHLMTDVWTSVGVLVGVVAVAVTGWQRLDPLIALLVAFNIVFSGVSILKRSASGLLDQALPKAEQEAVSRVLSTFGPTVQFHALRTIQSGPRRFISLHVLVPGDWTVKRGHGLLEDIERSLRRAVPNASVFTHLEAIDDPASFDDIELDRELSSDPAVSDQPQKA
ncbi:MAG: cation diffusion facilitator family transporter [Myxococcales bacterium]